MMFELPGVCLQVHKVLEYLKSQEDADSMRSGDMSTADSGRGTDEPDMNAMYSGEFVGGR